MPAGPGACPWPGSGGLAPGDRVKITDFGIALSGDQGDMRLTESGELVDAHGDRVVVSVDARCERLLLELLAHAAGLERREALRAHEPAGVHEAGQLVAGEEHELELALARRHVLQVVGVREHGPHEPLGIAQLA